MKVDPYSDKVLGAWKADKDKSKGSAYAWKREATITLTKQDAVAHSNEETFLPEKVYGKVTLVEYKFVDKETSNIGFMRQLTKTEQSIVESANPVTTLGAPSSYK